MRFRFLAVGAAFALVLMTAGCSEQPPASRRATRSGVEAPEVEPSTASRGPDPHEVWVLRSDQTLRAAIQRALERARERGTRVLLEFGADWCPDCNEVVRLSQQSPCKELLAQRYEPIYVHVGRFDRHRDLIERYRVERIATLVVLDGTGRRVAQTTLEPISRRSGLTSEALAAWLRDPRDEWRRASRPPVGPRPDDSPIFPPELVEGPE